MAGRSTALLNRNLSDVKSGHLTKYTKFDIYLHLPIKMETQITKPSAMLFELPYVVAFGAFPSSRGADEFAFAVLFRLSKFLQQIV